jgi:16S rRNA (guanine527-N7)-methyltransferase
MVEGRLTGVLERSRSLGFLGPGPIRTQVEHAEGFAAGLDHDPASVLDLGAGGGVPGLVLAGLWPDSRIVLLEAGARRCAFLREALDMLGISDRVRVVEARAEVAARLEDLRGSCNAVVARSFGPPPVTAECGAPFLEAGGWLVVSEPPASEPPGGGQPDTCEPRWPADGLARLGLTVGPAWSEPFHYQALVQSAPCPDEFPRRVGVPSKRPLF